MPERIHDFLRIVEDQIRWTRARAPLTTELRTHLLEQYDDCRSQGLNEEAALEETLRQMGDPVALGQELDRIHRPKPQWGLLCLTGGLVLTGSILRLWLLSSTEAFLVFNRPFHTVLAGILGFAVMLVVYFLDYGLLAHHARLIYGVTLLAGILSLIVSPNVMGVSYYTRYIVLCFPVVYALWVYSLRGTGVGGVLLAVAGGIPFAAIACVTPYMLGLLILLVSGFAILLSSILSGAFRVHRGIAAGILSASAAAAVIGLGWAVRPALLSRFTAALHPEADPLGRGYQSLVLREALSASQLWGQGSFTGARSGCDYWYVVPAADSDCFLTTIIFQLGWVPFLLLCGALLALLLWTLTKALRQKNTLGRLLATAILLTLGIQFLASVLLNLGFVFTGATCPFLVGNLHTVLDMGLMGLLLSVFRQEYLPASPNVGAGGTLHFKLPRYAISLSVQRVK